MCVSKASSVAFASPLIVEAHADMSSAAVEICSGGNATLDNVIMGLSYVVEEMGMTFPFPFTLEMDNGAARMFCLGSAHKTKLKHICINCRQEWVRMLRDRDIMTPVQCHVDSKDNDADLFTKILSREPFEMVRNCIMVEHSVHHDE